MNDYAMWAAALYLTACVIRDLLWIAKGLVMLFSSKAAVLLHYPAKQPQQQHWSPLPANDFDSTALLCRI
jgi:hypothetical protein